VLLNKKVDRTL